MNVFQNAKPAATKKPSGGTVEVQCGNSSCRAKFTARVADRNRGWGKFCSKQCKAVDQTRRTGITGPGQGGYKNYPRHDGHSPMKHKVCDTCGEPAINGVRTNCVDQPIEWYCARHEYEATLHPFSSEALGQW